MPCSLFVCTQGMVLSAEYIKKKLEQEMVLSQAFGRDLVSISFLLSPRAGQKLRFPSIVLISQISIPVSLACQTGLSLLTPKRLFFVWKPSSQENCGAPEMFLLTGGPIWWPCRTGSIKNKSGGTKIPSLWRSSVETAVGCHAACLCAHISCSSLSEEGSREMLRRCLP